MIIINCFILLLVSRTAFACEDVGTEEKEIIDGDKYRFTLNFDDNANITLCVFESKNFYYNVSQGDFISENVTFISNTWNECLVVLDKIPDTFDRNWKVSVYGENNVCKVKSYKINFFYLAPLPNDVYVRAITGSSFVQYLMVDEKIQSCYTIIDGTKVLLDVNSEKATIPKDFKLNNRLESIGRGKCGFRVVNIQNDDPKNYSIYGSETENRNYKSPFKLVVRATEANETLETYVGKYLIINCKNDDIGYCALYDPSGKRLKYDNRDCSKSISNSVITDFGIWKCVKGIKENMQTVLKTIDVKIKPSPYMSNFHEKKDNYLKIGCKINHIEDYSTPKFCRMISPDGTEYLVKPGAATDRISTIELDLENAICAIEIKLPLNENEKGRWTCHINDKGAFIDVEKTTEVPYKKHIKAITKLGDPFLLSVQVPYSSPYCYILSPNNTKFEADPKSNSLIGECFYEIKQIEKVFNGTWQFVFSHKPGEPMDIITYDLMVAENMFYYQELDVNKGDDVNLMCSTQGVALEYCIYVSPDKRKFYVQNNDSSSTISYSGNGLEFGDCGIKIRNAQAKHQGKWQCITKIIGGKQDAIMNLFLTVNEENFLAENLSLASGLGLSFGLLIAIGGTATFFFYRKWKSRNQETGPENVVFNASVNNNDEHDSDIPIATFSQHNYDTTGNVPTIANI